MAWLLSFCFDRHRQLKLTAGGALSYFHFERSGAAFASLSAKRTSRATQFYPPWRARNPLRFIVYPEPCRRAQASFGGAANASPAQPAPALGAGGIIGP